MVLEKRRHVAFTLVETHYHITLFTFLYLRISHMIHVFLINIIIVYYSHFYIFVFYMIHTNFQILFINTIARNLKFTVNGRINRFALSRKHAVVIHESRKTKTRMMNSKQWLDFCPCFHKSCSVGRSVRYQLTRTVLPLLVSWLTRYIVLLWYQSVVSDLYEAWLNHKRE